VSTPTVLWRSFRSVHVGTRYVSTRKTAAAGVSRRPTDEAGLGFEAFVVGKYPVERRVRLRQTVSPFPNPQRVSVATVAAGSRPVTRRFLRWPGVTSPTLRRTPATPPTCKKPDGWSMRHCELMHRLHLRQHVGGAGARTLHEGVGSNTICR